MKKIFLLPLALMALASCQQKIVYPVDYKITLDSSNTYYAGDPVKFNIAGDVDNLLFYSGEQGHEYKNKDRFTIPLEDVLEAEFGLQIQARYGLPDGLDIYISKDFDGLAGNDAQADKARIKEMYEGGMKGWEKLVYEEGASKVTTSHGYPISDYLDNFAIAFHYHPVYNGKDAQRTYWVNGGVDIEVKGMAPSTIDLSSFDFTSVMMNDEIEDPYIINQKNGSIVFDKPNVATIIFQGASGSALKYGVDGWVFSKGKPLNSVDNDKGIVVKNLQNYVSEFEYMFDKPGTYEVTFVGRNSNVGGTSEQVLSMQVTIMDRPVK